MKSATVISALALVAGVASHEHKHDKFHQERALNVARGDSQCSVSLVTVTTYGEWQLVPETSSSTSTLAHTSTSASSSTSASTSTTCTSTSTSTSSEVKPTTTSTSSPSSSSTPSPPTYAAPETTTAAAYHADAAVTPAETPAAAATTANTPAAAAATTASQSTSGSCSAAIAPSGDKWAFCYTPYTSSGGCKSADEVNSDLASLKGKGFTSIRTYANDCNGLVNIGTAARNNGLKLLVGINIDASGIGSYTDGQLSALVSWAQWDLVEMVIAGNEAVFNGWASASAVAGFIGTVKSELKAAGYCGPVTTAETLNILQQDAAVFCSVIDVVGANIHPFFNTDVSALIAGPFVATQLVSLAAVCNGAKPAYILETGWPSSGSANGLAIPGFDAQKIAIDGIVGAVGTKASIFSYQNDEWKAPGPWGVEQNWGCAGLF